MPRVLMTGANRGIGLGLAKRFLAAGWKVHACARNPKGSGALAALKGDVTLHALDVTDGAAVLALAEKLRGEPIDLLLNNAGVYGPRAPFGETPHEEAKEVYDINVMGPLRMAEAFAEHVAASERKQIANMSSQMGSIARTASGGSYIYRSSKAALNMVTKLLSIDLADQGITVVSLHPGWVQTDMGGAAADITVEEASAGLFKVMDKLSPSDNAGFYNYAGEHFAW